MCKCWKERKKMNLDVLNEVKNSTLKNDLNHEIESNCLNEKMNDLNNKLQEYLNVNKDPNLEMNRFDVPVDFELETVKNELGDTTILGKITIEKSAMKDLEKIQNKAENIKDKAASSFKNGLEKVYNIVKDTFIEKVADKVLNIGSKALKVVTKALGVLSKKILKI